MREFSIPALAEIPASATLTDVVFQRADQSPGAVIMRKREACAPTQGSARRAGHTWTDVTAAEFRDEVRALAKGILAAGIQPGDRVGLMSRTSYLWTLADYAIWTAGAVTVPVYETSSAEQVEWILSNSACRGVFAETDAHAAAITGVKASLPDLENIWLMDTIGVVTAAGSDIADSDLEARMAGRGADDLATIIYTSGTTGRPKGCELTHRNLLSGSRNAVQGALHELFEIDGSARRCCSCRWRTRSPGSSRWPASRAARCSSTGRTPRRSRTRLPETKPVFLLAVPRVFEKVFNSAQQQAAASGAKSRIFRAAADTAIALQQGPGHAGSWPGRSRLGRRSRAAGSATRSSTGSYTASCGPRSAAGFSSRSRAALRSASGSATSSAARASRCWRATA